MEYRNSRIYLILKREYLMVLIISMKQLTIVNFCDIFPLKSKEEKMFKKGRNILILKKS